jgi:O-antigen ligase
MRVAMGAFPVMIAPMVLAFILPFPHTVALRLVCLLVAVGTAAWFWRRLDVPAIPFKAVTAIWALVAGVSVFYAVDPAYTIGEVKNEILYSMLAFVAALALTRDEERLALVCLAVAAGFAVISVAAIAGFAWYGRWFPDIWYVGAPPATNYLVMAAPMVALGAYLWMPGRIVPVLAFIAVLLAVLAVLSGQRAIWPALAAQAVVASIWLVRKHVLAREPLRTGIIVLAVLVLPAIGLYATEELRTKIEPFAAMEKDLRPVVWKEIVERIAQKPLSGAGFGREALAKAYPDIIPPSNPLFWHAHNVVLNYGVSAGIPGMLAILLLFGTVGWRFWRIAASDDPKLRAIGLAGALVVTGVFTRNMFNDFFVREGAIFFWSMCGALLGVALRATANRPQAVTGT